MSSFRTGTLSTYSPTISALDAFSIKTSYISFGAASLISSSHINHYFDACIKMEKALLATLPQNLKVYDATGSLIEINPVTLSTTASGFTLSSQEQSFYLDVPSIFGVNPFSSNSFAMGVQVSETPASPSTVKGQYANTNPNSKVTWQNLLNQRTYNACVSPVSGSLYKVQVQALGSLSLPNALSVSENGENPGDTFGTTPPAYVGTMSLTDILARLNPDLYYSVYYGVNDNGSFFVPTQRPFVAIVPNEAYSGFGVQKDTVGSYIGLSSFYSLGGRSGFAQMTEDLGGSNDQSMTFRYKGFMADAAFVNKPYSSAGPVLRFSGDVQTALNGYMLLIGDRLGTGTTASSETAPRQAYLAKMVNAEHSPYRVNSLVDTLTGAYPRTSITCPGVSILTAPVTLSYSDDATDVLYRFKVASNVVSLESSVSGGAFSTVLTYTDGSPITSGNVGFSSLPIFETSDETANRWLLFDSVTFGSPTTFTSSNIEIRSLFAKYTTAPDLTPLTQNTAVTGSTTLSWNDSANTFTWGKVYGFPWQFGNTFPVAQTGRLVCTLDWDPNGYHNLPFSVIMRRVGGVDLTDDAKFLYFTVDIVRNNFIYNGTVNNITSFSIGFSPSVSASSFASTPFIDTTKIAYFNLPLDPNYIVFSGDLKRATIKVPLSVIPVAFRTNTKTIYLSGAIRSNGLDGAYISDIRVV